MLLREIKRVSKYQIFEVPIDFSFNVDNKLKFFLSYGHINIYTPSLFRFLIKSENLEVLSDINHLYDNEVLNYIFKKNKSGLYKLKLKHFLMKMFPYLLRIKPSSYAVLTTKSKDEQLSIF